MRAPRQALLTLAVAGLIAGCSANNDYQDIKTFMDEVDARGKGQIEPLPEFLPYQAFAYGAGSMRSPFEPPVVGEAGRPEQEDCIGQTRSESRQAVPRTIQHWRDRDGRNAVAGARCTVSYATRMAACTACRWETTWEWITERFSRSTRTGSSC